MIVLCLLAAVVAVPRPFLHDALCIGDEAGAALAQTVFVIHFVQQIEDARRAQHGASPAGATDDLLLAVFNDLASVAQGVTALRRSPGEDELIQRFADPLREGAFVTGGGGASAQQQGEHGGKGML